VASAVARAGGADGRNVAVEQTYAAFGRIDGLLNNAGIYRSAAKLDVTEEHWDAI